MAGVPSLAPEPGAAYELIVGDLDPPRAVVRAVGELDLAAREDLTEVLRQENAASGAVVRLDLSEVTFLDCSCLGVLVGAHHRYRERDGLLLLTGVGGPVARLLRVTRLEDTLFIVPDDADAFDDDVISLLARRPVVPRQRAATDIRLKVY